MWRVASSPIFFQVFPPSSDLYAPSPQEELCRLFGSPVPTHTTEGSDGAIAMSPIVDAPAHRRGANLAEFQILELIGGIWLVAGRGQRAHRQRAKNRRTSQNRPPSIPCMLHFHPPVCKARLITPAGPHSASNVLKEQTNPLQRQTCRPTAPFHDSVIPLIAALSRHATRAPALAFKSLRPHARLSNCFH